MLSLDNIKALHILCVPILLHFAGYTFEETQHHNIAFYIILFLVAYSNSRTKFHWSLSPVTVTLCQSVEVPLPSPPTLHQKTFNAFKSIASFMQL